MDARSSSAMDTRGSNWGVHKLLEDLLRLSEDHDSADVVFLIGKSEEKVYAHRIILMARCKSFRTAKRGEVCRIPGCSVSPPSAGNPAQVRLPHARPETFKRLIVFLYTGKIQLQDTRVFELMSLAQDIGAEDLRSACEEHVTSALSVVNACTFLSEVIDIQERPAGVKCAIPFIERCISFIGENAKECIKTNSFRNLSKDALISLISSDYLCLEEEDVWRAVLAWAKHQAGVTQPTAHWAEEERARVCQHLAGVIGHVRLLLIDSQVFAEEVEPTGAVPIELSLERYRYAALHSNGVIGKNSNVALGAQAAIANDCNDKRLQPRLTVNLFPGSAILQGEKMSLQNILNGWYGKNKQSWRLIFRASCHKFSATAFHRHCDGISPLFVILLGTHGEICGGFTDVPWSKNNSKGGYIFSEKSFLFTLQNEHDPPTRFDVIKKPYALCYHPECGPIFGAGADLFISPGCNNNLDSYSNLPHSYDGPNASCSSLMGDYNFSVLDYEVFTVEIMNDMPAGKSKHERLY
ncbi:uncharacterized protein LOC113386590 [Ctenocephalides felis]|uniref:uncharacterized protein LOC113386590 n=1 Tax=Ctenocephalides felis TaxID=7515 RepID=UPI000E6E1276|nr:uncharacterized protein LOC113386590 [Ctenocephalides felis]